MPQGKENMLDSRTMCIRNCDQMLRLRSCWTFSLMWKECDIFCTRVTHSYTVPRVNYVINLPRTIVAWFIYHIPVKRCIYMLEETEGLIKYVTLGTLDKRTTTNITQRHNTTQNTKKIRKADPSKNRWLTHVIAKGKQFLSLIGLHAFFPEFIYV
jgi:hypothetical protein